MNRLPLTTTHAKRVSDAYSRVPCSQSVIFTHGLYFNIPEALPHNKISAWPWANISQRTYMSLLLWPPVDLQNRMLCISKADISIFQTLFFCLISWGISDCQPWMAATLSVAIPFALKWVSIRVTLSSVCKDFTNIYQRWKWSNLCEIAFHDREKLLLLVLTCITY